MNCIFCNKPIIGRRKGDHIIPQGLGKFTPELTVLHSCKECDSKNGAEFERIVLRTGILSVFRSIKGIKSNNHKGLPMHSPSLDKFRAIESEDFHIKNVNKPDEDVYIASDGTARYANSIIIKKDGALMNAINIPPTRDIRKMCDFIEANTPKNLEVFECELHISQEQMAEVSQELSRRGRRLDSIRPTKQEAEFSTLKISFLFTDNHFRFVASTILKGMIFLGYSTELLLPMVQYVKTGESDNLIYRGIDKRESGTDTLDDPPLNVFYHKFEWSVTDRSIEIAASILAHRNVNGIRAKLSVKAGRDSTIVVPYGKIIAKYGDTPNDGKLEVFLGDNKIERPEDLRFQGP